MPARAVMKMALMKREDYRAVKQMDRVQMQKYFGKVYARGVAAGAKATAEEAKAKIQEAFNRGFGEGVNAGIAQAEMRRLEVPENGETDASGEE